MNQNHFSARRKDLNRSSLRVFIAILFTALSVKVMAQTADGNNGITQATTLVKSYFPNAILLMYAIGAVVGIVGAVKVYNAWSHGDQQTNKLAASWFGACIFLVVVATVLKNFFGV